MTNDFSRRDFLKALGFGPLAFTVAGTDAGSAEKRKPNVIIILSDDQGSIDARSYGADDLYTPNIDALVRHGVRFTQCYVGAPVCSASRASLLTGRYPQRAELDTNAYGDRGLPPRQVTIAEMMKEAGYRTGLVGKWHLGDAPQLRPIRQGFDEFFGHKVGCIDNYSHFFYWQGPNRHDLWKNDVEYWEEGGYFPEMTAREAKRFITENKDRPFFLYLAFNMPHYPLQGMKKFRDMYSNLDNPRAMYAAFVSTLDEKIGDVIATVDSLGLRNDTIIVFLSDHGHSTEERTFGGGGNNGPYRGHKFTVWEGGIRVPCAVSWPGHIPEGETRAQMVTSLDWFPTIAGFIGAHVPNRPIDGMNIAPVIASSDAPSPHKVMHWEFSKHWAVREGDWKLVHNGPETVEDGRVLPQVETFLSNLSEDVSESNNIASQHPDIVRRLTSLHEEWAASIKQQEY